MTIEKLTTNNHRLVLGFLLVTTLLLSAGCSDNGGKQSREEANVANVTQPTKETTEERVARRAQAHMDALIARDWAKAYEYLPPATRQLKPLQIYADKMKSGAIIRTAAKVKRVECETDVCQVTVDLSYIYSGVMTAYRGEESKSLVKEKWIFSQGDWWLAPQ